MNTLGINVHGLASSKIHLDDFPFLLSNHRSKIFTLFFFLFLFFLSYRVTGFPGLELCDSTKYEKQTVK